MTDEHNPASSARVHRGVGAACVVVAACAGATGVDGPGELWWRAATVAGFPASAVVGIGCP